MLRSYELECIHGVGHSGGVHGCDGCCGLIAAPAEQSERDRIKANILDRVKELRSCTKDDNCNEFGAYIESYIEEWIEQ